MPHTVRKLFLLLAVTAFVPCSLLYAASEPEAVFSIGVLPIGPDDPAFRDRVIAAGTVFCPEYDNRQGKLDSYLDAKALTAAELEREEQVHQSYLSEDPELLERAQALQVPEHAGPYRTLAVDYRPLEYDPKVSAIAESGTEGLGWLCQNENLDGLLLVTSGPVDRFVRLRIGLFSMAEGEQSLLLDRLLSDNDPAAGDLAIGAALLKAFGHGILVPVPITGAPGGLQITESGVPLSIARSHLFLPVGDHELTLQAFGYASRTAMVTVGEDSVPSLDASLDPILYEGLSIHSKSGVVSWYVNGEQKGSSADLKLETYSLPLTVYATKEGFLPQSLQTDRPADSLSFDLKPSWMGDKTLLGTAQKEFYSSLRGTIFLFGLYVACTTLSGTNGLEGAFWQPLLVATSGMALVTSVTTIKNLASYVSLATR